jgi:hypothetical protein
MDVKLLLVVICCVIYAVNADRPVKRSDVPGNSVKVITKLANDSKTIAKRGIFSLGGHRHHHHATFSLVPASSLFAHHHKTIIKPAVAAVPAVPAFVHKPSFVPVHPPVVQTPTVIHQHTPTVVQAPTFIQHRPVVQPAFPALPVVPSFAPVAPPTVFKRPASVIPFTIVPGGASVSSYAVNFPRYPFIQRTPHLLPVPKPILPAVAPAPVLPSAVPVGPTILPYAPLPPPQFLPAPIPTKPIIPVAIPFPGIQKPKIPLIIDNKPIFQNEFYPSAIGGVNPQFVPIPVPAHPTDSGNTNANQPTTQNQLQFAQQLQHHQFLQQQQQQFEQQQQWQQLQHFQNLQNQQQQQQQQQDYQTEQFNLNYDAPSNNGQYNGPSSYEVPPY